MCGVAGRTFRPSISRIGCILLALLLIPLVVIAAPTSAFAEPQIILSPSEGAPGTKVEVTGSGYAPLALISITFDGETMDTRPKTLTADALGNFEATFYVPHSVEVGMHSVVAKGHGLITSSAESSFQVTGTNRPPEADSQSFTTDMNKDVDIILRGSDPDGDEITFSIVDGPQHGNITRFDSSKGTMTYVPDPGYSGRDRFTFKVNDGNEDSFLAEVSIMINESTSGPRMENMAVEVEEDNQILIYLSATHEDSSTLSFSIVTVPQHGSLSEIERYDGDTVYVTYSPLSNFNGTDSFTAKASDSRYESETATVTITVMPVQDNPVANRAQLNVTQGQSLPVTLTATDPDGDTLTFTIESQPAHGTLVGNAPDLTYLSSADYRGWDSFNFKVNDGISDSNIARIEIFVWEAGTTDDDTGGSSGGSGSSGSNDSSGDDEWTQLEPTPVTAPPQTSPEGGTDSGSTTAPTQESGTIEESSTDSDTAASVTGDLVPPRLILPVSNLIFDSQSDAGSTVTYNVAAIDDKDGEVVPQCSPESGYNFPIGKVNVICNAVDSSGNSAIGSFTVEVRLVEAEPAESPFPDLSAPIIAVAIVSAAGVATYVGMRAKRVNGKKPSPPTATRS